MIGAGRIPGERKTVNTEDMIRANQSNWNERVPVHLGAESSYDVQAFKNGQSTLAEIEREMVGDVKGKKLLHLMCHFGMDTLSWVRAGADATGIDFSPEAVNTAKGLAQHCGLQAEFICSDVYALPRHLASDYDVAIATYGVLCWLPSIERFMDVVSSHLKKGGIFVLVDGHPLVDMYEAENGRLAMRYSYFDTGQPDVCESKTSYTGRQDIRFRNDTTYQWSHDLGTILNAAIRAGMEIVSFNEYPFAAYKRYPFMVQKGNYWELPSSFQKVPMLMCLKARRR
jgi:SAM-dependent methyltransferase